MHPHQIDTAVNRRERRSLHGHDGQGGRQARRLVGTSLGLVLLCVLSLSGCNSGGSGGVAIAQQIGEIQNKRIETFIIDVTSFVLKADGPPNIEVKDNATVYIMQSNGDVTFQPSDGSAGRKIDLEFNDIVIERPDVGAVTVMRDQ